MKVAISQISQEHRVNIARRLDRFGHQLVLSVRQDFALMRLDEQRARFALADAVKFAVLTKIDGIEVERVVETLYGYRTGDFFSWPPESLKIADERSAEWTV